MRQNVTAEYNKQEKNLIDLWERGLFIGSKIYPDRVLAAISSTQAMVISPGAHAQDYGQVYNKLKFDNLDGWRVFEGEIIVGKI